MIRPSSKGVCSMTGDDPCAHGPQDVFSFLQNIRVSQFGDNIRPHKYLLLLSIVTLHNKYNFHANQYLFTELEPIFLACFEAYFPAAPAYSRVMDDPFYHMKNDGFWHLRARQGLEGKLKIYEKTRMTKEMLLETVEYAYLDKAIYDLFCHDQFRELLGKTLTKLLKADDPSDVEYLIAATGPDDFVVKEGGSLFKHEQTAIDIITANVTKQNIGQIASNILIYDHQSNNYYEYDLIIAAGSGIYVVELKHWSGHIHIRPYTWVVNNTLLRNDPHKSNILKCKILKSIYRHNFKTYPDLWVESIVVLTNPESTSDGANSPDFAAKRRINNPTFASIPDLFTYLQGRGSAPGGHLLDARQVSAVIDHFKRLNTPREQVKYAVPGYKTVEYLSQKPECIELIARPLDGRAKGLHRFRVFRPLSQMSEQEKRRFTKKAYNTLDAVSQMGYHPHVQKVWVIKNEYGDIIEGSDWSETGTLKDLIRRQSAPLPQDQVFGICRGILHGLGKSHESGVIHRAVKPENILMFNGIPKLINFDLAYQLEDNRLTVMPDTLQVIDDGYVAPEVLLGGDISESTDLFGVGVIAYELLVGNKPFTSIREFLAQGGMLQDEQLDALLGLGLLEKSVEIIIDLLVADRTNRLGDVERVIAAFTKGIKGEMPDTIPQDVNPQLQPGEDYDVYEILTQIGDGPESQVYKARTLQGSVVILKLFNKEVARSRIMKEAEITSTVTSSYVVHSDNRIGHWKGDRFFLVLDYIPGETLRHQIENREKPDIETFRTVAFCLLEAIKAFHQHEDDEGQVEVLLHGDIKPDNIIITPQPGSKAVLIDCGIAGKPRIDVFQGTNGYVPPDSIRGLDMEFSKSGDIFALGVTLWEWLFERKPYDNPAVGDVPIMPTSIDDCFKPYIPWLLKAVATRAEKRFSGVGEMQDAFARCHGQTSMDEKIAITGAPETTEITADAANLQGEDNAFVRYINSLSEASAGNENAIAEAQLASEFFDQIYVDNPLADFICRTLTCDKMNVILTGNAGDGKTTIAADIYRRITGIFPKVLSPKTPAGDIIIVKDMSELSRKDERAGILEEALMDQTHRYLIVSNTGTLLEGFRTLGIDGKGANESDLLRALAADEPTFVIDDHFMVINIANMDSIETACRVFGRILAGENWSTCKVCHRLGVCPIIKNVKLLQDNLHRVSTRITLLYRRLYEYDVRLTMRQMTGHLAYAITAGKSCADIKAMSLTALKDHPSRCLFFNRIFGDDGCEVMPEARQLLPVRRIREAEFGTLLDPHFERRAWLGDNAELFLAGDAFKIGTKLAEQNNATIRREVRRMVYFLGALDDQVGRRYIATFLRSPMLNQFLEYSRGETNISRVAEERFRRQILQVLQEYFVGVRLPAETRQGQSLYITLTPFGSGTGTQMALAVFRETDFNVCLKHRYKVGDNNNHVLCLCHKDSNVAMTLSLPFFDFIARRYDGEIAEELSAHYATRLEQFKVDLLNIYRHQKRDEEKDLTLIRVRYGGGFDAIKVHVSDASLEVFS